MESQYRQDQHELKAILTVYQTKHLVLNKLCIEKTSETYTRYRSKPLKSPYLHKTHQVLSSHPNHFGMKGFLEKEIDINQNIKSSIKISTSSYHVLNKI